MRIENREYRLFDFLKIPFTVSPILASLRVLDKIIYALIPSLQVLTTAAFIDTAMRIVQHQAPYTQILPPLLLLTLLISHQYITFALMGLVRTRMDLALTAQFHAAITDKRARLQYRHIENNDAWDLIARASRDPEKRIGGGFDILLRMADLLIRVTSLLLILITQAWWAALAILAFSVPLFTLAVRGGKANYEASKEAAKHTRRAEYLQTLLTGRDTALERSLFRYTRELNRRYHVKYTAAYKIDMQSKRRQFIKMKTAALITVLISILIAAVLLAPLGTGAISIGMFMSLVTAAFSLAQMMSWELTYITSELANNREYLRDLSALGRLSETPDATAPASGAVSPVRRIEFRDVTFAYPDTDTPILKNLSLTLYAGKHYAFVGANGAGKTTLTKLLTGLYDNYAGEILIDGRNLRDLSQPDIKALFSIVYQDFAKYQIPLRDSIGLGNPSATDADLCNAVQTLGMQSAVEKLPLGLDTPLGRILPDAVDLSGGEWQRVAIARSLISRAPVHILDEPTAALDPVAESEVYELFDRVSQGKTTIFITHRLAAARLADEILVIEGGRVAERGPHDALMARAGRYAEMFESQRGWYA